MKTTLFLLLAAATLGLVAAVPGELLAKIGALLFSGDFERTDLGASWRAGVHSFTVADGVFKGSQVRADHGAVGTVAVGFKNGRLQPMVRGVGSLHERD